MKPAILLVIFAAASSHAAARPDSGEAALRQKFSERVTGGTFGAARSMLGVTYNDTTVSQNPPTEFGVDALPPIDDINVFINGNFGGRRLNDGRMIDAITDTINFSVQDYFNTIQSSAQTALNDPQYAVSADLEVQSDHSQSVWFDEADNIGVTFGYGGGIIAPGGTDVTLSNTFEYSIGVSTGLEFVEGQTISIQLDWAGAASGVFPVQGGLSQATSFLMFGNEGTQAEQTVFDNQFDRYSMFAGNPINFGVGDLYDGGLSVAEDGSWDFDAAFSRVMEFELVEGADGNGFLALELFLSQSFGIDNLNEANLDEQFGAAFYDARNTFLFDLTILQPGASITLIPTPTAAAPIALAGLLAANRRRR